MAAEGHLQLWHLQLQNSWAEIGLCKEILAWQGPANLFDT
jgi:hypothetical protein